MSKRLSVENVLTTFPRSLSSDEHLAALASVTATELLEIFEDNDIVALYARIDELDGPLLDILAYDFKIDWWDENFSLEEKRETFKNSWNIHRILGTPVAVYLALSAIYQNASIQEWWEYGGNPFYFRILINTGEVLTDYEKLLQVIAGARYYKNKRSLLELISIEIEKQAQVYVGLALQGGNEITMQVAAVKLDDYPMLADELDAVLMDENGQILFD